MLKSIFVSIEFYSYRNPQPPDFGRRVVCLHCSVFSNTLFASETRALAPILSLTLYFSKKIINELYNNHILSDFLELSLSEIDKRLKFAARLTLMRLPRGESNLASRKFC